MSTSDHNLPNLFRNEEARNGGLGMGSKDGEIGGDGVDELMVNI